MAKLAERATGPAARPAWQAAADLLLPLQGEAGMLELCAAPWAGQDPVRRPTFASDTGVWSRRRSRSRSRRSGRRSGRSRSSGRSNGRSTATYPLTPLRWHRCCQRPRSTWPAETRPSG